MALAELRETWDEWRAKRAAIVQTSDAFALAGANALKTQIETFWAERGHTVQVWLEQKEFNAVVRAARYDVRSDLVNGMPREPSA